MDIWPSRPIFRLFFENTAVNRVAYQFWVQLFANEQTDIGISPPTTPVSLLAFLGRPHDELNFFYSAFVELDHSECPGLQPIHSNMAASRRR
jgi:hypothetical protein